MRASSATTAFTIARRWQRDLVCLQCTGGVEVT
jgi:hypothetical protein